MKNKATKKGETGLLENELLSLQRILENKQNQLAMLKNQLARIQVFEAKQHANNGNFVSVRQ